MIRRLLIFMLIGMGAGTVHAIEGDSLWLYTYGGAGEDVAYAIVPTDDGFLSAGTTSSFGAGDYDVYLVKVNSQGDLVWQHNYGGTGGDLCWAMTPTNDGNYLLTGCTGCAPLHDHDMYLVKVDAQGILQWSRSYDISYHDEAYSIVSAGDGGFILAGATDPTQTGNLNLGVLKVNAMGDSVWSQIINGGGACWGLSVISSGDGNFLITGCITMANMAYDVWLVKLDAQGTFLWSQNYGGSGYEWASCIIPAGDGNFLLAGRTSSYGAGLYDMWLVKVNLQGDTLWTKTYGGAGWEHANSIVPTIEGGFLLTGQSTSFGSGLQDIYLVKINADGDTQWTRSYGGNSHEYSNDIILSGDGNYLVVGETYSFGFGRSDMFILKVQGLPFPPVYITLNPSNPPITIPANGGRFYFNATVSNDTSSTITGDAWIMVRLPSQSWYGPVLGPLSLTLPGNSSVTRLRSQSVPAAAPAGEYWYEARVGDHPSMVWDTSGFAFTKLGSRDWGLGASEVWLCTGEPFPEENLLLNEIHPLSFILHLSAPNPFNPTTTISYELQAASHVKLSIYDTSGRLVSILADGWRDVGKHEVTFDGSGYPSGIYLYRLFAGSNSVSNKIVLLK